MGDRWALPRSTSRRREGPELLGRDRASSFREQVERLERSLLTEALSVAAGNQSEAARRLGLSRVDLLGQAQTLRVRLTTLTSRHDALRYSCTRFLSRHASRDRSDHVIAVTTIVSRARSARAALWVGALWGLGHSATILTVGGAIVLFGWVIPPRLGLSMEMSVAVMLIVLGAMNLSGALTRINQMAAVTEHAKLDESPVHHVHVRGPLRPLIIGVVHGLAGSAAVALLVLTDDQERQHGSGLLGDFRRRNGGGHDAADAGNVAADTRSSPAASAMSIS